MSEDRFTEVTHTGWGSRITSSFKGIILGLVFFIVAFPLLFWNEGRAVKRYKTLKEGQGAVVSIDAKQVNPQNEGRLVHVMGQAIPTTLLEDPQFPVTSKAIKLKRIVEMYQWQEDKETSTRKKLGGGEETITEYTYSRTWSSNHINSSGFKKSDGHQNPGSMPFSSNTLVSANVTLDAFILSSGLVSKINAYQPLAVNQSEGPPLNLGGDGKFYDTGYYIGQDPGSPRIGDIRIKFQHIPPLGVSLIAKQQGNRFVSYRTRAGGEIELLQTGTHTAEAMFERAQFQNTLLTWGIRLGGLLLMAIGLGMILKPLSVIADVIPLIGNIVGTGTGIIAFVLSLAFSMITVGVAWIVYRPVLGIGLFVLSAVLISFLLFRKSSKKITAPPPLHVPSTPTAKPPASPPAPPKATGANTTESPAQLIQQGKSFFKNNDPEKALECFTKAIEAGADDAATHYNRGVVNQKMGKTRAAMEDLKIAARLGNGKARAFLASKNIKW